LNCPECGSDAVVFITTRKLTYKVEGVENGELILGELVEEEEVEGTTDSFSCGDCDHKWART